MAGSNDFTGQNIQDTYQRVLQISSSGDIADGTGSALPLKVEGDNIRVTGDIIAQQYVVSSSVTNITTQQLSGSTSFGDSSDDIHRITGSMDYLGDMVVHGRIKSKGSEVDIGGGHITASGNITADGDVIVAGNVKVATRINFTNGLTENSILAGNPGELNFAGTDPYVFAPHVKLDSHLTASGNISSSGTIVGSNLSGTNTGDQNLTNLAVTGSDVIFNHITASGDISASGEIYGSHLNTSGKVRLDDKTALFNDQNELRLGYLDTWEKIVYGKQTTDIHEFHGSITASGDISASGILYGTQLFLKDQAVLNYSTTNDRIVVGNKPTLIQGNLTASGDISSSGTITAAHGSDNGYHIGTITALDTPTGDTSQLRIGAGQTFKTFSFGNPTYAAGHNFMFFGNITASGDISSSGTITANEYILPFNKLFKAIDSTGAEQNVINNFANGAITFGDDDSGTFIDGALVNISSPSLKAEGDITASGDISASGTITSDQVRASTFRALDASLIAYMPSSTIIFGNDSDQLKIDGTALNISAGPISTGDTFTSTNYISATHITASGDISASGTVQSDDGLIATRLYFSEHGGSNIHFTKAANNLALVNGGLSTSGEVTASAIAITSASSNVTGMSFLTTPVVGFAIGSQNANSYYQADEFHQYLSGNVIVGGTTNFGGTAKLNVDGNIATDSHITASGNISSSGTIVARKIKALGSEVVLENGHITASGNISASGEVTFGTDGERHTHTFFGRIRTVGSEVVIGDGHVTASGTISASGDIFAGIGATGSFDHIITQGSTIEFKDGDTRIGQLKVDDTTGFSFDIADGSDRKPVRLGALDTKEIDAAGRIEVSSHITASGDISSSGNVLANGVTTPRINGVNKNLYVADPTLFPMPITASSDISSSGTITAATYKTEGGSLAFHGNNVGYDALHIGFNTSQRIAIGKDSATAIQLLSDITASGHISASGNVTGNIGIFSSRVQSPAWREDTIQITSNEGPVNFVGSSGTEVAINCENGQITASGAISASGNIQGNTIISNGSVIGFADTEIKLAFENNTPIIIGKSNNPTLFNGPISSSGHIKNFSGGATGSVGRAGTQGWGGPDNSVNNKQDEIVFIPHNEFVFSSNANTRAPHGIIQRTNVGSAYVSTAGGVVYYATYVCPKGYQLVGGAGYGSAGQFIVYASNIMENSVSSALIAQPAVINSAVAKTEAAISGSTIGATVKYIPAAGDYFVLAYTPADAADELYGAVLTLRPI